MNLKHTNPSNHAQWWTISVLVMSILICTVIAWLHFEEVQTLNETLYHLDNFRQAHLDLNKGFIQLSLSNNENAPFDRNQGIVLLNQALDTFDNQMDQLNHVDVDAAEFRYELDLFHEAIDLASEQGINSQTWVSLWIAFDRLESYTETLDLQTLDHLHTHWSSLTQVFSFTIVIAIILFGGIGFGVYRSERARYLSDKERQQSEMRYRAIVEDQSELICRYMPDFTLTFANSAYSKQYGKPVEEVIGLNLLNMIPEKDRERAKAHVLALNIEQPVAISEHRSIMPDGTLRWQQWSDRALFDEFGNIVEYQGVGRDITDTKSTQERLNFLHGLIIATSTAANVDEALRESIRLICESQQWEYGEIWVPDSAKVMLRIGAPHYIYDGEYSNKLQTFWEKTQAYSFLKDSGVPGYVWENQSAEWIPDIQTESELNFLRIKHGVTAGLHGLVAIPIVDKGEVLAVMLFLSMRYLKRDDELLQLINTAIQQIAPIIRNQQATDTLAESEERYRTLVENFDGVITVSDSNGTFLFANETAWKPFNLSSVEQRQGKRMHDLYNTEIADSFVERSREVIITKKPRIDINRVMIENTPRWFHETIAPIKNPDGSVDKVVMISFDITVVKEAEKRIQESEERYRQIVETAQEGILLIDLDGTVTFVNQRMVNMLGYSADEVLGHPLSNFIEEDALQLNIQQLGTNREDAADLCFVRKDGTNLWGVINTSIIVDEGNNPVNILGMVSDITKRKEAKDALRESETRLRAIIDSQTHYVIRINMEGYHTYWNSIYQEHFAKQDLAQEHILDCICEYHHERTRQVMESCINQPGKIVQVELDKPNHEGVIHTSLWEFVCLVDLNGNPSEIQCMGIDITQRKQIEQALQESEAQLLTAQEIAHLGSWTLDLKTNETVWSDEFFRICGLEPDSVQESLEMRLSLIHPDDRFHAIEALNACREAGEPYDVEKRIIRPNGEVRWVVSQGYVKFDEAGKPATLVGTFLDITERKETELVLEQTLGRLSVLHAVDQLILESDNIFDTARETLDLLLSLVPANKASIFLLDQNAEKLTLLTARDNYEQDYIDEIDQHAILLIAEQKYHLEMDEGLLIIGLKYKGECLGILQLYSDDDVFLDEHFIQVGVEVADQLAIAIHTVQLNEKIREYAFELSDRVVQRTAELQLEKTRTEAILQSTSDGILLLDSDLEIKQPNQAFKVMFSCCDNITENEKLILSYIHADDQSILRHHLERSLNENIVQRCEVRAIRNNNQIFYVEIGIAKVGGINGDTPNLVCTIRDVTHRKLAEAKLAESEELYRTTISAMSEGIILQNSVGTIQIFNSSVERILGVTSEQLKDVLLKDWNWTVIREDGSPFPNDEYPSVVALRTGKPQSNVVLGIERIDKSFVWILVNAQPVQNPDEDMPHAVVTTFTDITDRKTAQDALQQAELRYRALFEQSTDGVFILDLNGNHRYVNQHASEMLGYTSEELINLSFRDIIYAEDQNESIDMLSNLLSGKKIPIYERRVKHKNGKVFPVEINVELVWDKNGRPLHIQSMMRDITERKIAEISLRESESKYRSLIDTMHGGFAIYDEDDRFAYVNDQLCEMFGYAREELIGRLPTDFTDNAYKYVIEAQLKKRRQMESDTYEIVAYRKNGTPINLLTSASPLLGRNGTFMGSSAVITDITPQKEAQEMLLQLTQRLQLATEAGGIGVWEHDIIHNRLFVDKNTLELYGFDADMFDGLDDISMIWMRYVHPDDVLYLESEISQAIQEEKPYEVEFRIISPQGNLRYIKANAIVIRDNTERPVRMVGVNMDVTQIKEAENALLAALEQEKELGELKSRFVSMASHEFRTPLATISATTETLLAYRDRLDGDKLDARLHKILKQVHHMKDIMEDILQLARIQAGRMEFNPELEDLDAFCHDIVEEFRSNPDDRNRIIFNSDTSPLHFSFDIRLMRHIVSNLISNALKYSPADQLVQINLQATTTEILLEVADQGIGIPDADLKRLFEPFHRASNVGTIPGTGLGLSITKEAVELHGGTIIIDTQMHSGTTFKITLPLNKS